jgi:hypothetical protein
MMRYFPIILFLSFSSSFAQPNCLLVNLTVSASDRVVSEQRNTYNEAGRIIEEWKLNSVGLGQTYTSKKVFEYNAKGYLSKVSDYLNGEFKSSNSLFYDNLGSLVSETQNNETRALNTLTTENGRSQKLFFNENGTVSGKEVVIKNSEGKLTNYEIRNGNDVVNHAVEYQYNGNNQEVYILKDDVAGHMKEETHFQYDDNAKLIKDSTYLNSNLNGKTLYAYVNGYLSRKTTIDRKNKVDYEILYINDIKGLVTEENFVYQGNLLSSIQREYNQNNNLIIEKRFNNQNQLLTKKTWEYTCPN